MVTQPGRRSAGAFVAVCLVVIAFATLWPTDSSTSLPATCIFCGSLGGVDFALNIALLIPLGIGLRWIVGNWKTAAVLGALTSPVIETLQWRLIPGRDASLGDLLANTIGVMLGVWLATEGIRWLNATGAAARRLTIASGLLMSVVVVVSAVLLQPAPTRWSQWVQWTPVRKNMDIFPGQLDGVAMNGVPIRPAEMLRRNRTLDTAIHSVAVRATITGPVAPTKRAAHIVRIANNDEEGFALTQRRASVLFRTNQLAARLKLRTITVELANAFPSPDDGANGQAAITIDARSEPGVMAVSSSDNGIATSVALRRTVGLAWAMLVPWDIALSPTWWPANAAWLAALVLPVAYFASRTGRSPPDESRRGFTWWPVALVLATMAIVPSDAGASFLGAGEWLGVLLGVVAGALLGRPVASVARR